VLGSSGSVIPLFQSQLENGGPITVTHPDMTRYFMTVPEAVELVLLASTLNSHHMNEKSAIYVLDMGEPIKIQDVAIQMIKLAGLRPEEDIKIRYTGIRPGEKLYEELFYEEETVERTTYEDIVQAWAKNTDIEKLTKQIDTLINACQSHQKKKVVNLLLKLVPQYQKEPH
jgi:O-antigen biosynthesis protein WbqV